MKIDNDKDLNEEEKDNRDKALNHIDNEIVEKLELIKKRIQ